MSSRDKALGAACALFDGGEFLAGLQGLVAVPTESQNPARRGELRNYITQVLPGKLQGLGGTCSIVENPVASDHPFLIFERIEDQARPTVLVYGHGDVVMGAPDQWRRGLDPWQVTVEGPRWYGRGVADNKGQHWVNICALTTVLAARGTLGFNLKLLIETGEETGSPGLAEICQTHAQALAADVLIASDGPRLAQEKPCLFMGARGAMNFTLSAQFRDANHHSGNWGGLIKDAGIRLVQALATLTDANGAIAVDAWRPPLPDPELCQALEKCAIDGGDGAPQIDENWGEPGLTPPERVFGWNNFAVLTLDCGQAENPQNAIPGQASATCQLRFVVGTDMDDILPGLRRHLEARGFGDITIAPQMKQPFGATRMSVDHPWVRFAARSVERTTRKAPDLLPNLGGSLPNNCFADTLGLPTIWVPHSYPGCRQHGPDEHGLAPVLREGLAMMTGIFWDLGAAEHPPE
ncbi:MAG: M20 family metallopeptidase [Alphaproteobacteria bacterium]